MVEPSFSNGSATDQPPLIDDQLADLIRLLRCDEAWLDASHAWLASREPGTGNQEPQPRPLSLGSLDALRRMKIDLFAADSPRIVTPREIALYRWLHTAPLPEVKAALWSGTWDTLFSDDIQLDDIITASFMAERDRLAAILKAVTITIRPKPKRGKDDTPPDVVSPALEAFRLVTIAGALRADLEHVRWHLFIGQALQAYHVALWESGRWTVIPGREVKPEDVEDLEPGWMKGEPE
jgi:hypothetical protein